MRICLLCEPNYEPCEGAIPWFCEEHEPEAPKSEPQQSNGEQTRREQPGETLVQGRLFDQATWSSH